MDDVEALRIAAAQAKDLFDLARQSGAPQKTLDQLQKDWGDAMDRVSRSSRGDASSRS